MIRSPKTAEEPDWDFYTYALDAERAWQKSLLKLTERELLAVFPGAREIFPVKIAELEEKRTVTSNAIRNKLTFIKNQTIDEFSKWFWREWVKITDCVELLKIEKRIAHLRRLQLATEGRTPKGHLTDDQIQQATAVPIENLTTNPLRKSGKTLIGLCPFHSERSPSFHIYPKSNSCWCFGCNQGGDVISFVRLLYGYSFQEAVRYILGK